MAKKLLKISAKISGDVTTVRCLIGHPMETGLRRDKEGKAIPAHFIQNVTATHNGNTVITAHWSAAVSRDPYFSFKFSGAKKGDMLTIAWTDNKGGSDSAEAKIK